MSRISYTSALREEYRWLWETAELRHEWLLPARNFALLIEENRDRYVGLSNKIGIPWNVIALIHAMESSCDWNRHLHNGDWLKARTVHVPAGRPMTGVPPFTWEESAEDALCACARLHRWRDWDVPGTLYVLERYNGFGYRLYHKDVLSPYLWSGTDKYLIGKYGADGKFNRGLKSKQCGAVLLWKTLEQWDRE